MLGENGQYQHMANTPGMPQPQNAMAGRAAQGNVADPYASVADVQHTELDRYKQIYNQAQDGKFNTAPESTVDYSAVGAPKMDGLVKDEQGRWAEDDRGWMTKEWDKFKEQLSPVQGKNDERGFWERGWDKFTDDIGATDYGSQYQNEASNQQTEQYNEMVRKNNLENKQNQQERGSNMKEGLSKLAKIWGG